MNITIEDLNTGVRKIALSGRMDIDGTGVIGTRLTAAAATTDRLSIVIDMAGVEYIGSLGLGTFVAITRAVGRRRGKMVLFSLQPEVAKVFETSKMDQFIPIVADVDAALAAVQLTAG
ncbi:MAG TPA: STAS domain-containing protein [Bacteroidota bacterium]|nr:STAS domain-containing protein [Bacteroidota bacterium]